MLLLHNPINCTLDASTARIYDCFDGGDGYVWMIGPHYLLKVLVDPFMNVYGNRVMGEVVPCDYHHTAMIRFKIPCELPKVVTFTAWKNLLFGLEVPGPVTDHGRIAIMTLAKHDWRYAAEWIEWHRLLGVEHFYIYNNCSDKLSEAIRPFDCVTEIPWTYPYVLYPPDEWAPWWPNDAWVYTQPPAIMHCLRKFGRGWGWIALIDMDEFINPSDDLGGLLSQFRGNGATCVSVRSRWYGTADLDQHPPASLIKSYNRRETGFTGSDKCIVHPKDIRCFQIHEGKTREGIVTHANRYQLHLCHYSAASDWNKRRGAAALTFANDVTDNTMEEKRRALEDRNES